jgi:hypothetical protein
VEVLCHMKQEGISLMHRIRKIAPRNLKLTNYHFNISNSDSNKNIENLLTTLQGGQWPLWQSKLHLWLPHRKARSQMIGQIWSVSMQHRWVHLCLPQPLFFVHRFSQVYCLDGSNWEQLISKVLLPHLHLMLVISRHFGHSSCTWHDALHLCSSPAFPQAKIFAQTFPQTGMGSRHVFLWGIRQNKQACSIGVWPQGQQSTASGANLQGLHGPKWHVESHLCCLHFNNFPQVFLQEKLTPAETLLHISSFVSVLQ